jgi:signal transduction histidine kinase
MARIVDVRRDDVSAMRDASAVPAPAANAGPETRGRRWSGPGRIGPRRLPSLRGTSLAARFLIASMAILLVAGVAVGLWVGDLLERSIIEREAAATGLYVESIIGPDVASLAEGSDLTAAEVAILDAHLSSTPLTDRLRSLRIWSPDGRIVYSPDASLIGRSLPMERNLEEAWKGEIVAGMDDLTDPENAWERERWSRLLEMFIPLRERGTDRIIAVAELYLPPRDILAQVGDAQRTTWIVVSLAIVASAVLLFGIVKQGSDTIKRQEVALTRQVGELTQLVDHNASLSERVRTAAERSTTLNERSLRRVSTDLHDGPGQMLSLALLRLDSMRDRAAAGRPPGPEEVADVEVVLREAMTDMRAIAAGLRVPELAAMGARAIAERAVSDHERRSGAGVALTVRDDLPASVSLPVKIALFRALQEALSNATRHGGGTSIRVTLGDGAGPGAQATAGSGGAGRPVTPAADRLTLEVSDEGTGFDPSDLSTTQGLGLAGIREQAELLGGGFGLVSSRGAGTRLSVWWPVQAVAELA